jgi:hypothetical protein
MVARPRDPSRRLDRIRAIGLDSGACHRRYGGSPAEGRGCYFHPREVSELRLLELAPGLEPGTCYLQDSRQPSIECWCVLSLQVTSGGSSSQCARDRRCNPWWNDKRNDRAAPQAIVNRRQGGDPFRRRASVAACGRFRCSGMKSASWRRSAPGSRGMVGLSSARSSTPMSSRDAATSGCTRRQRSYGSYRPRRRHPLWAAPETHAL